MRSEPTWRIPVGILALMAVLGIYAMAIASLIAPLIAGWHPLLQMPVYVVLGVAWIFPIRRFLTWMETGNWK